MTTRSRNNRRNADTSPPAPGPRPIPLWQWFLLAAAAPIALCAARLNDDLWHDEIYTLVMFAAEGPAKIVTDYSAPNNHVLYSLVLWIVQEISTTNFALRLPSLAFSIGTLAMTYRAAWRLGDQTTAVLATLLLGLNQMFLIHAIQVRGYPLAMFLFAWLINIAIPDQDSPRFSRLAGIALVGAAFLYVTPSDLLLFAPLAAIAVVWQAAVGKGAATGASPTERTASRRTLVAGTGWTAAFALAALCYAPIASQIFEHRGARTEFAFGAILFVAETFLRPATHDFIYLAPVFLLGLIAWCVRRISRGEAGAPAALVLAAGTILGAFLLTAALGVSPFPRNFAPLLPLVAMAQAWTLRELLRAIPWKSERAANAGSLAAALVAIAVLAPQLATYAKRLDAYCCEHPGAHDGYFNYYAADYRPSAVVERVRELTADGRPYRVCYAAEDHWNLAYYFKQADVPLARADSDRTASDTRVFVIAPHAADWADIAARCELSESDLRRLPIIEDFGYYVLRRRKDGG